MPTALAAGRVVRASAQAVSDQTGRRAASLQSVTCWSAIACGCVRSLRTRERQSAVSPGWGCARLIRRRAWRRSASGSAGARGCPTRSGRISSSGSSPSHPGLRKRRSQPRSRARKWGGLKISEHGVWRVLVRVALTPCKAPGARDRVAPDHPSCRGRFARTRPGRHAKACGAGGRTASQMLRSRPCA